MIGSLRSLLRRGPELPAPLPRSCALHRRLDREEWPASGAVRLAEEVRRRAAAPYSELAALAALSACCVVEGLARAAALRVASGADPMVVYYPHPSE